jgi:hypothetical protein
MARGSSGRIVIEVSPDLKRQLYSALAIKNQTLKDWFVEAADDYLGGQKEANTLKKNGTTPSVEEKV